MSWAPFMWPIYCAIDPFICFRGQSISGCCGFFITGRHDIFAKIISDRLTMERSSGFTRRTKQCQRMRASSILRFTSSDTAIKYTRSSKIETVIRLVGIWFRMLMPPITGGMKRFILLTSWTLILIFARLKKAKRDVN